MSKKFYDSDLAELHVQNYDDFVEGSIPGALSILKSTKTPRGTVLDLGCGGGQLSHALIRKGYKSWGLDVSPAMIRIAKKKTPEGNFIHGSILTTPLPKSEAAIAIGEIFNYLKSKTNIQRAFFKIHRALRPGGVLIFDLLEPAKKRLPFTRQHFKIDNNWAIFTDILEGKSLVRRSISTFVRSGAHFRRQDETHEQGLFHAPEVAKWLRDLGFQVTVKTKYGDYRVGPRKKVLIAKKTSAD